MKIQRFKVSNTPHLTVICHGDLDVNGGRDGEVAIKVYGAEKDLAVEREGERLTVTTHARCKIGCPQGASVTIPVAHCDLRLRRIDGPIAVEEAHGDTVLKDVGPTTITIASGDVRARSVRGALQLDQVRGDLAARDVEGILSSEGVGGDLRASYLGGGLQVTVGGDAALTTDLAPGCGYRLKTGGDAVLKFPSQTSAKIQVNAGGEISHKADWAQVHQDVNTLSGRLGEGEANVEIDAGGDVSLHSKSDFKGFAFNFYIDDDLGVELESMAEEIERNVAAHMARMSAQLETKLGQIDHEDIQRKVQRAAEKVQRKAERAAERARQRAERAQRRWERMGARRPARPGADFTAGRQDVDPVSEEERLTVLKMVQEGKITPDEAAQLLEAMER